jgi:hypothetical protein
VNKLVLNQLGEDAERKRLEQWCKRQNIPPEAQKELLIILYGKPALHKENI